MLERLKPIRSPARYKTILSLVNKDIENINSLIDEYNQTYDNRDNILVDILKIYRMMERLYSSDYVEKSEEYREQIHHKLYEGLLREIKQSRLNSILSLEPAHRNLTEKLPQILAQMPTKKLSLLLEILLDDKNNVESEFKSLYAPNEEGFDELDEFLRHHTITYLGGGNSRNFKITPDNGSSAYVLMVENRLGNPKIYNTHFTNPVFLTEKFSRQASAYDSSGHLCVRHLTITEFCIGSDLESYARYMQDKITSCIPIFIQMLETLIAFQTDNIFFPDMKNTNWLVNDKGQLKIADTKTLLMTKNNHASLPYSKSQGYQLLFSDYVAPPEFHDLLNHHKANVGPMHAFMLGKNLFQYLSNCSADELVPIADAKDIKFSEYPIFQSQLGKKFKNLIKSLVKFNATERLSLNDALQKLKNIQQLQEQCKELLNKIKQLETVEHQPQRAEYLNKQFELISVAGSPQLQVIREDLTRYYEKYAICQNIVDEIALLGFGKDDTMMNEFIREQRKKISAMTTIEQAQDLQKELQAYLQQLKNPVIMYLHNYIQDFKTRALDWFSIGMNTKANRIENAMAKLTIIQRLKLSNNLASIMSSEDLQEVFKEMARHRHIGKQGKLYLNKVGQIDESKAAHSFLNFKKQLEQEFGEQVCSKNEDLRNKTCLKR